MRKSVQRAGLLLLGGALSLGAAEGLSPQYSLFTDHRTHHVDDLVTIIIDEQNAAADQADTKTQTQNDWHALSKKGKGVAEPVPSAKSDGTLNSDFKGDGKTTRAGNVDAVVSARVTEVLANGDVVLEGTKRVVINDETEILTVTGIVRSQDISADNSVHSSRIANAHISYAGEGTVSSAQGKGVIARLLDWLF